MTPDLDLTSAYSVNLQEWTEKLTTLFPETVKRTNYRTEQICDWLYKKRVGTFADMTNLPSTLRGSLAKNFTIVLPIVVKRSISVDGTEKYLLQLRDGKLIEMVVIPEKKKTTLCVSSQIGCLRHCSFCATAKMGFVRNLTVDEIVSQIITALNYVSGGKITNLVFMGMGEPMDNLPNVIKTIQMIQDNKMLSFSPRRITVSTCGVIPGIRKLRDSGIKIKLAVSLNSADQRKRETLMPVAKIYSLAELKRELQAYRSKTAFRITFEYIMIKDFNTSKDDAKEVIKLLGDVSCKLNLLSWNKFDTGKIAGLNQELQPPSPEEIERFIGYLKPFPFAITYRKSLGGDIEAACGQLAVFGAKNEKK
jgi:23S rRNA (adenine2503-C2)-methyltransferase